MNEELKKNTIRADFRLALEDAGFVEQPDDKEELDMLLDFIFEHGAELSTTTSRKSNFDMLSVRSVSESGSSIKFGNIRFKLIEFLEALAGGVLAGVGVLAYPWTAPLALLILWAQFKRCATVTIGDSEAKVIWAMHGVLARTGSECFSYEEIHDELAELLNQHRLPMMSQGQIRASLSSLEGIESVVNCGEEMWKLVEEIEFELD